MVEDEAILLDRWCAGDKTAGNALLKLHFTSIYRFFDNKVIESDVDELVQQTFFGCTAQRDSFRRESSFRTFLFRIAHNRLYSYWRQRKARGESLDVEECSVAALSTSIGGKLARSEEREELREALRLLPLAMQELLELFYWEDLDAEQLAEIFGVAPATIRSRLFRARQLLRKKLRERNGAGSSDDDAIVRALRGDDDDDDDDEP